MLCVISNSIKNHQKTFVAMFQGPLTGLFIGDQLKIHATHPTGQIRDAPIAINVLKKNPVAVC